MLIMPSLYLEFAGHLQEQFEIDYSYPSNQVHIVPYPIDLVKFRPSGESYKENTESPKRIAVVGRIASRKGIEDIIELSHRLNDLAGEVVLEIFGGVSLWSDYRLLLGDLNPRTACYHDHISHEQLASWLPSCIGLIQPARYEPFGLTVGEALACGVPVIATTEVGAAEDVSDGCVTLYKPGCVDQLEKITRSLINRMASPETKDIRLLARTEAERLWSPNRVAAILYQTLNDIASLARQK